LRFDIWISLNMCVILGERQFLTALLRSARKKYKCLTVQITCECLYYKWNS